MPPAQVKPGKSRQIVANEPALLRTSIQARSTDGWRFLGPMRYDFCKADRGCGRVAHVSLVDRSQFGGRRSLTDGAAFADRPVLGRHLSGLVGGRRTRLSPRLATGR